MRTTFNTWWNWVSGQGTSGDHGAVGSIVPRPDKTVVEITELLKHAPLVRVACEAMAEDITRAWRQHSKQAAVWVDIEERLDIRDLAEKAMFYSEGYGGAFIIPRYGSDTVSAQQLEQPMPELKAGLLGFGVYPQHNMRFAPGTTAQRQANGLPILYAVDGLPNVRIHHSWVYGFKGPQSLPTIMQTGVERLDNALGQSRVDIIYDDFARMAAGLSALSHILVKGNIDVLKIKGLAEALSRCNTTAEMQQAIEKLVVQATSTVSGASTFQPMVIDAEESLTRENGNHSGAPQIVEMLIATFVAATRIPRTRLLGEQAKGLGNGGEADLTSYYDRCATLRERRLTGFLNWVDGIAAPGRRTAWEYRPLWELSASAAVEVASKQAAADKIYYDMNLPGIEEALVQRLTDTAQYIFPANPQRRVIAPAVQPVSKPDATPN